jgi:hypothetical protein
MAACPTWARRSVVSHQGVVEAEVRYFLEAPMAVTFLAGFGLGALLALVLLAFDVARMLGAAGIGS